MKITLHDHGEYFRGLLLLARKDSRIDDKEKEMLLLIGKLLGFEKEFCQNAVRDALENEYIPDEPPKFTHKEIAQYFLHDALQLALVDGDMNEKEMELLNLTAVVNNISKDWVDEELELVTVSSQLQEPALEAGKLELH